MKIESKLSSVQNPADTHINACAVLSQLGRHQTALEHAQNALILLQEELLNPGAEKKSSAPPQTDRIAVLAIAYHNIGVEQEFLKKYEQSMLSYRKGVEVAERYLGTKHPICITLKNSLIASKKLVASIGSKPTTASTRAGKLNLSSKNDTTQKKIEKSSEKLPDLATSSPVKAELSASRHAIGPSSPYLEILKAPRGNAALSLKSPKREPKYTKSEI